MRGGTPGSRLMLANPRRVALTAGGFALLVLAIALATLTNFARQDIVPPSLAGNLDGQVRVGELQYRLALANGKVSPELRRAAITVASRAPLASEPFAIVGVYGMDDPRSRLPATNAVALHEALRRDPRSRAARLFLIRGALVEGRIGDAIRQVAELDNIDREIATNLIGEAGKRLASPSMIAEASGELAPFPRLYESMTAGFTSVEHAPELLDAYVRAVPRSALGRQPVRSALVQQLVDAGKVEQAIGLLRAAGIAPARATLVDPDFRVSKAERPFAWDFLESEAGVAERQKGGGVFAEYYGRRSGTLVRQLVVLPPGNHRLAINFEPTGTGAIALQVRCAAGDGVLASLPLTGGKDGTRRKATLVFTVPVTGCPGQWVEIDGLPQVSRDDGQVLVHRLELASR